jgi:hypothetical protein
VAAILKVPVALLPLVCAKGSLKVIPVTTSAVDPLNATAIQISAMTLPTLQLTLNVVAKGDACKEAVYVKQASQLKVRVSGLAVLVMGSVVAMGNARMGFATVMLAFMAKIAS